MVFANCNKLTYAEVEEAELQLEAISFPSSKQRGLINGGESGTGANRTSRL